MSIVFCFGNKKSSVLKRSCQLAGATGLGPATSCVTGMHSNQLNYAPSDKTPYIQEKNKKQDFFFFFCKKFFSCGKVGVFTA